MSKQPSPEGRGFVPSIDEVSNRADANHGFPS